MQSKHLREKQVTNQLHIAAWLVAFVPQVVFAQPADRAVTEPLRADRASTTFPFASDGDGEASANRGIGSAINLPKCSTRDEVSRLSDSPEWASYHQGRVGKLTGTASVDVTSVSHCQKYNGDLISKFHTKYDFGTGSKTITFSKYNCTKRAEESSGRSWIYLKNGVVSERLAPDEIGNPLPVSSGYKLIKFVCDTRIDHSVNSIPDQILIWDGVNDENDEVVWSILRQDNYLTNDHGNAIAAFWVRKDYSRAKWTKFRYTYSYDKIRCEVGGYRAGQPFGFLPNAQQGSPVYEESMLNIAPGSVQAAVMAKVCAGR